MLHDHVGPWSLYLLLVDPVYMDDPSVSMTLCLHACASLIVSREGRLNKLENLAAYFRTEWPPDATDRLVS